MVETVNDKNVVKCDGCGTIIESHGSMACESTGDASFINEEEHFCDECSTPANQEFVICDHCGLPMIDGMCNDGSWVIYDFNCHEECFEAAMDERYGKGRWRLNPSGEPGEYNGYYDELLEDGTWEDTGIFYTEWY
jgi:hypothetical protein